MVKKLFALASVTTLAGLVSAFGVAGCSDDETGNVPQEDAGTPDAKKEAGQKDPGDDDDDDDDIPGCAANTEFSVPSQYTYVKAGKPRAGECSEEQVGNAIDAMTAAAKQGAIDFDNDVAPEIKGEDPETCAACLKGSDTEWRLSNESAVFTFNPFGCLESQGLVDTACAKGLYDFNFCLSALCDQTTCGSEYNACANWAVAGPCKDENEETASCPDFGGNLDTFMTDAKCNEPTDIAGVFCGGEKTDGGT